MILRLADPSAGNEWTVAQEENCRARVVNTQSGRHTHAALLKLALGSLVSQANSRSRFRRKVLAHRDTQTQSRRERWKQKEDLRGRQNEIYFVSSLPFLFEFLLLLKFSHVITFTYWVCSPSELLEATTSWARGALCESLNTYKASNKTFQVSIVEAF